MTAPPHPIASSDERTLLVLDDIWYADLLRDALAPAGWRVLHTSDPEHARALLEACHDTLDAFVCDRLIDANLALSHLARAHGLTCATVCAPNDPPPAPELQTLARPVEPEALLALLSHPTPRS